MESFSMRKYKDDLPLYTINKIRNILTDLGVLAIETGWQNSAKDFYSVNLSIINTNITTNGKGTTPIYSLASAYGEFMERLQNQTHFRMNMDLGKEALEYQGFYYAPDERQISIQDFCTSEEDWISIQKSHRSNDISLGELLEKWKHLSYEEVTADFIALPYLNMKNHKISYIPIKMISKMYMSNGMCSGNSMEEALVQGLSEVFERYVNKEIVNRKLTPPTIPREYINKFPSMRSMIAQIEESGNYEVIIKDCSLGEGYPVVCAIYWNKNNQSYFVKLGSHPIFEVAVERTLTELLQGQDIRDMKGVKEYSYQSEIDNEYENLLGILVNGSGYYPPEMFSSTYSYEFKEFTKVNTSNNKEMLKSMIELLENHGYQVFIRDVSFLGFPSFHVIVPIFSEIDAFDDTGSIDNYSQYNEIKHYIRNLKDLTDEKIDKIIQYFEKNNYNPEVSIFQFLNLPINNILPWYYSKIDLYITALYYKKGDYIKAYDTLNRLLKKSNINQNNQMEYIFYKCARDYIGTKIDGLDQEKAIQYLNKFYALAVINGVITDFGNSHSVLTNYGEFECWNCSECNLKQCCLYKEEERLYKALKDKYSKNPIEQSDLYL